MRRDGGILRRLRAAAALACACAGSLACRQGAEADAVAPAPPASVAKTVDEGTLATITLSEAAERRLGIQTEAATVGRIALARSYPGDLTWAAARGGPAAGAAAYAILPTLQPLDLVRLADLQIAADEALGSARITAEVAARGVAWAEERLATRAGSRRELEDARAQARLADAALRGAEQRRALLGAPAFAEELPDRLWVRVRVYAGDADRLRQAKQARVLGLGEPPGSAGRVARALPAHFRAEPAGSSAELFFELEVPDRSLVPGERVSVEIPLGDERDALLVPWSAVLFDVHGGTWVYRETAPHAFERRRVEVLHVEDGQAALAGGIEPGAAIVSAGAAELFGAQLGFSK
jgi:hypothetical protein